MHAVTHTHTCTQTHTHTHAHKHTHTQGDKNTVLVGHDTQVKMTEKLRLSIAAKPLTKDNIPASTNTCTHIVTHTLSLSPTDTHAQREHTQSVHLDAHMSSCYDNKHTEYRVQGCSL